MKNNLFYIIFVLGILVLSRIIPHPPNFTPILGTAIMAPTLFKDKTLGIFVVIASMFMSDIVLGFHPYQLVIYFSFILIIFFSNNIFSYKKVLLLSILGSTFFFIVTNFAVWVVWDFYEKSLSGLLNCYTLALPFYANTLVSTILFASLILFLLKNLEIINEKFNNFVLYNFNKFYKS